MVGPMRRTPLYESHLELGARMVDFAGYEMPLHYQGGINQEHLAVRHDVGLFDVSHMGEIRVLGPQATEFLRFATLNDPAKLRHGRGQYSMLPNDRGGLVDDLFVYREKDDEIDAYDVAFWLADEAPSVDFFYRARGEILVISEMHFPRADASLAVAVRAEDGERPSQIRLADESPYWDLVVVVPTTEHFSNSRLEGWSESRRTLAEVLHFISEESKITLLRSTEPRSFLHFLLEHGLSAVILFAALLLLLVARTLLRVGPVLTPPLPGHRSFVEYLEAVGHFARRRGGEKKLLEAARAEVLARFVKRRPELASLEGDALVLALSEHVALDRETIARALRDDPRGHPRAFVDVMNALQELRKAP